MNPVPGVDQTVPLPSVPPSGVTLPDPNLTPADSAIVGTPPNNAPYVIAVIIMALLGVLSIISLEILRPLNDNTQTITTIIGFLAPTTLSLLAFMKAQETHLSVNSRLDAFIKTAQAAALNQGIAQGNIQGQAVANARTDALNAVK